MEEKIKAMKTLEEVKAMTLDIMSKWERGLIPKDEMSRFMFLLQMRTLELRYNMKA